MAEVEQIPTRQQRKTDGGDASNINVRHHPPSHWRRLYKRGLARQQEVRTQQQQERRDRQNAGHPPRQNIEDCSRCFMQKRGFIMIPDSCVCTCTVDIPKVPAVLEEDPSDGNEPLDMANECYMDCLVTSVTLGTVCKAPALYQNDSPITQIKEKRISEEPKLSRYENDHVCDKVLVSYSEHYDALDITDEPYETADWMGNTYSECERKTRAIERENVKVAKLKEETERRHVLIYAPPGSGKTTVQRRMYRDGISILDTDDIPGCRVKDVTAMLKWTSILTNRIDLIQSDYPVIMFCPKRAETLRRFKAPHLSDNDYKFWYQEILKVRSSARLIIMYEKTYVTDWLKWSKANSKGKFTPTNCNEIREHLQSLEPLDATSRMSENLLMKSKALQPEQTAHHVYGAERELKND